MTALGKAAVLAIGLLGMISTAKGQDAPPPDQPARQEIALWPGAAPRSENWTQKESDLRLLGNHVVYNIVRPTLTVFSADPKMATGAAMIVAPGGGFMFLSIDSEGNDVARWLAAHGITAFVLKYRTQEMPESTVGFTLAVMKKLSGIDSWVYHPVPKGQTPAADDWPSYAVDDGLQALRIVRERAREFGYSPDRVGFMGFSAGAATTYGVMLAADDKPAVIAPLYVTLAPDVSIPSNAPPIFMAAASDDPLSRGMPATYMQWIAAGRSAELHMYASGGHGFGMPQHGKPTDAWTGAFEAWLHTVGFLPKP